MRLLHAFALFPGGNRNQVFWPERNDTQLGFEGVYPNWLVCFLGDALWTRLVGPVIMDRSMMYENEICNTVYYENGSDRLTLSNRPTPR